MNRILENINNLTSLWKNVSDPFGAFYSEGSFSHAWLNDSEWPNRIWLNHPADSVNPSQLRLRLMHLGLPLKITIWDVQDDKMMIKIADEGFEHRSTQLGMSLKLDGYEIKGNNKLDVQLIGNHAEGELWSRTFQQSFGYYINPKQLIDSINCYAYLYSIDSQVVGTGILHITGTVAGIHAIGVVPDERRKGYAEMIMNHLIEDALRQKCTLSTLQASDLGKGLYLKLGYREDFKIQNFI